MPVGAILPPSFAVPTFLPCTACTRMYYQSHHSHYMKYHPSTTVCSLPLPREMALRRMAPCGSVHRASHGQQKGMYVCMACPSRRVQRAPGAYPTRCVGDGYVR
jgi:hypothetical protein